MTEAIFLNVTENQLDEWVRGNARDAQGVIVELVWRLVAASSPQPKERRFPLGDSIGQHGPDGFLDVGLAFDPFVPEGFSFWEIGTGSDAAKKATSDYKDLVTDVPESTRHESTFVFVTPLSGRRDWQFTWKEDAQAKWIEERRAKQEWRDVRVIDGTKLIDWVRQFPPVQLWLAERTLTIPVQQLETTEQHWNLIRTIGAPPLLTPGIFLANREEACTRLAEVVAGTVVQLKLETHFPDHVVNFVSAYLADLDSESRADAVGRWLIVSGSEAWNAMASQEQKLTLISDSTLDLSGETGTKLIQKARMAGHAVIFGGPAGGIPDPASVRLRSPRPPQVQQALEEAGYSLERARTLAQKSGGNLSSLLRCLQNLSLMPEWAEGTPASDLVIAEMLGSWTEESEADRLIVEGLSGKPYGEWIGKMREVVLRPGTPLTQEDGNWRFTVRYEGWFVLGPKVFDDHLSKLRVAATSVLMEKDPQFELPSDKRYAASIYGKVFVHSHLLRNGLAESLALLGSYPRALTSCTLGRAEATAALAVREILADADWERWASLNDVLPLLAEASQREFLDAVEKALASEPCPFDRVFAEEGPDAMSRTYMSGILWALETLAWDPDHLSRVVICLGELAARDPGGRWLNRPANSLTTILLPWLPQTCATPRKRGTAVSAVLAELPDIGWKLLLSLLPQTHSTSTGTRRPAWRETIPDDWPSQPTHGEYWEQIERYSEMTINAAKNDGDKLVELIDHIEHLSPAVYQQLLAYLGSDDVVKLSESARLRLWTQLVDLVTRHRKFSDAEWAMKQVQVDQIASVAERLAPGEPALRCQRLFSERDFDLYEGEGNYEDQRNILEVRRQKAVMEVAANGGAQAVFEFAAAVQSPSRVGIAYGAVAPLEVDQSVLPALLESAEEQLAQFAGGFVWSRFYADGWQWVDGINTTQWTSAQIGQFLALLPFVSGVWKRSKHLLGADGSSYWSKTTANPYQADTNLEFAVDELIKYGRPNAALRCLHKMLVDKQPFDAGRAVRALLDALDSSESIHSMDAHETVEIIKALQNDPATSPEELLRVEWEYLPWLDRNSDASPKLLERRMATEPEFFCDVVRLAFGSQEEDTSPDEPTKGNKAIATNAYHLLREWQFPPGYRADGTFDGEGLSLWLTAVKEECTQTGHLEIAMTMIGHSLVHVPPDPDGLWIHRSAAAVLNARDGVDMRDGFRTEMFNARGVHWIDPTGSPERKLANQYREQAEALENAGYHRLTATLKELAESYEYEAERIAADRLI